MVGLKLFVPTSMPTLRPVRYEYSGGAGGPGTTGPALQPEKSKGGEKTYKEVLEDKEDLVRKVSDADKTNEILLDQRDKIEKDLTEGILETRKRLQTKLDEEIKAHEDTLNSARRLQADYNSLQNRLDEEIQAREDVLKSAQRLQVEYNILESKLREEIEARKDAQTLEEDYQNLKNHKTRPEEENKRLESELSELQAQDDETDTISVATSVSDPNEENPNPARIVALINWL